MLKCVSFLLILPLTTYASDILINQKALEKLQPEIIRLTKTKPLPTEIKIIVIQRNVVGWFFCPNNQLSSQIIILDKGENENIRTLRHEWQHASQFFKGCPYDEEEAKQAENE